MTGRRYDLIVACDRRPHTDPDANLDHVEAGLASLRPYVRAHGGAWLSATANTDAADDDVLAEPAVDADDTVAVGANLLRSLYQHQPVEPPHDWFDGYLSVNHRHAATIAAAAAPSATVWVHGHHLQLVPGLLRRLRPDLAIVAHVHDAFPPAELFTRLPEHRDVLSGLLGADLVALPHRRAVDNLLDLAGRVYGLPVRGNQIAAGARRVRVIAYPLPADATGIRRLAGMPQVRQRAREIRDALRVTGPVLLSVAGWDPAEAVEQRLRAFERFVVEHRPEPATVALMHMAHGEPQSTAEHQRRERIDRFIAKINGVHATLGQPVVHYVRAEPDRRELVAFYLASDALLATPAHHATVVPAHEFVAARSHGGATVVLSELTTSAEDLPGAIVVNPHDSAAFADAIALAAGLQGKPPQVDCGDVSAGIDDWAQRLLAAVRGSSTGVPAQPAGRIRRQPPAAGNTHPTGHPSTHDSPRKIDVR